jgi:hypothetical protein
MLKFLFGNYVNTKRDKACPDDNASNGLSIPGEAVGHRHMLSKRSPLLYIPVCPPSDTVTTSTYNKHSSHRNLSHFTVFSGELIIRLKGAYTLSIQWAYLLVFTGKSPAKRLCCVCSCGILQQRDRYQIDRSSDSVFLRTQLYVQVNKITHMRAPHLNTSL